MVRESLIAAYALLVRQYFTRLLSVSEFVYI